MNFVIDDTDGLMVVNINTTDGPKSATIDVWRAGYALMAIPVGTEESPRTAHDYWQDTKAILAEHGLPVTMTTRTAEALQAKIYDAMAAARKKAEPGPDSPG